jgi:hypothetical protein
MKGQCMKRPIVDAIEKILHVFILQEVIISFFLDTEKPCWDNQNFQNSKTAVKSAIF